MFWIAPPSGTGSIAFRVMIYERRDLWYQDEGSLSYEMREDTRMERPTDVRRRVVFVEREA